MLRDGVERQGAKPISHAARLADSARCAHSVRQPGTSPLASREKVPAGMGNIQGADFILLTADFEEIVEALDHEFTSEFEGIEFGHEVYQLTIPNLDIELVPGRYYIGARYVGVGSGRSWAAGQFTNHGETEAYIRSDFLGYPDWTPNPFRIDGVFQVYGDIIPAPPTLALTALAPLTLRRRR